MSLLANVARYMLTGVATTIVVGKCITEPISFKKEFDEIQKAREKMMENSYSTSLQVDYSDDLDYINDEENIKDAIDNASDLVEDYADMKEKKKKIEEDAEVNKEKHDGICGPPNEDSEEVQKIEKMIDDYEKQEEKEVEQEQEKQNQLGAESEEQTDEISQSQQPTQDDPTQIKENGKEQDMDDLLSNKTQTNNNHVNNEEGMDELVQENNSDYISENNAPQDIEEDNNNEENNNIKH